jgi:hypothetical protein
MKEKVIETAGKAWRVLGERGESDIPELARLLREREDVVNQAIGWLAREDKISYSLKRNRTFISLVDREMQAFKQLSCSSSSCSGDKATGRKRKI